MKEIFKELGRMLWHAVCIGLSVIGVVNAVDRYKVDRQITENY